MVSNPKISIIIPIYNAEHYLNQCIDSVLNQSLQKIEVILINDGSTDSSPYICDSYAQKDKRIKVVHTENGGLSSARNKGIDLAIGDYIMFLDSDDWLDLNTCIVTYGIAEQFAADVIMWPYVREYGNKSDIKKMFNQELKIFDENETKNCLHRRMFGLLGRELIYPENADLIVTATGKLYKTKIIKDRKIRFVSTKLIGTEDALFNVLVFEHVKKTVYINRYFYHYRRDNSQSLTTQYNSTLPDLWNNLFKIMGQYIEEKELGDSYTQALNNRISLSIIGLGLKELSSNNSNLHKIRMIKNIINNDNYRKSIKTLPLEYMPVHWKSFFALAKLNSAVGVYVMLILMNRLRKR